VVISLFFLNKAEKNFSRMKKDREITFVLKRDTNSLQQIVSGLNQCGIKIYKLSIENEESSGESSAPFIVRMQVKLKKPKLFNEALLMLTSIEGVIRLNTVGDAL
jgi:putative Mg2+ transporter-C (MgtC) family protein